MVQVYNIFDIKDWFSENSNVLLPVMQRGYVWKPYQIELIWDSILRGFPIGTFIMSKVNETNKQLLDGQQRSTSIILGFYNPWKLECKSIGNAKHLPVVWIDLKKDIFIEGRKYFIRVVTQSHPWGYCLEEDNKILKVADRRESLKILNIQENEAYTKLSPTRRIPYDSFLPIPLAFLLEPFLENKKVSYNEWKNYIQNSVKLYFPDGIETKYTEKTKYISDINDCDFNTLYTCLKENVTNYEIPSIEVNSDIISENSDYTSFVRINTEGTQLTGEELIYSIYKSKFSDTKNIVESISENVISPTKTISIVSRLAYSKVNNGSYIKDINIGQFQRLIAGKEFKDQLLGYINDNNNSIKNLYDKALEILRNNDLIPNIVVRQVISRNINMFALLLHWLEENIEIDENLKKNICARFYRIIWFGDSHTFVKEMWERVGEKQFWSIPVNSKKFVELPLICPNLLKQYLESRFVGKENLDLSLSIDSNPDIWNFWRNSLEESNLNDDNITKQIIDWWAYFIETILHKKSLVQIVQKKYLEKSFPEFNQLEQLEDTNVPWDWDHIYPSSWIYNRHNIPWATRYLNNTIGNLRLLSLSDNRSQGDNLSPSERLNSDSFIQDNDYIYWKDLARRVKQDESFEKHSRAIIERCVNIYDYCYKNVFYLG